MKTVGGLAEGERELGGEGVDRVNLEDGTEGRLQELTVSCLAGEGATIDWGKVAVDGVPSEVPPLITVVKLGVAGVLAGGAVPVRSLPLRQLPEVAEGGGTRLLVFSPVTLKAAALGLRPDVDLTPNRPSRAAVMGYSMSALPPATVEGRRLRERTLPGKEVVRGPAVAGSDGRRRCC